MYVAWLRVIFDRIEEFVQACRFGGTSVGVTAVRRGADIMKLA